MKLTKVAISSEANLGLLAVLFPCWPVYKKHLPPFLPDKRLVLIREGQVDCQVQEIVQVVKSAEMVLDSVDGFVKFLGQRGIKVTEETTKTLHSMEFSDFLKLGKIASVLKSFSKISIGESSSMFQIFHDLFDSFDKTYSLYRSSSMHYRAIFSSLVTMMMKTEIVHAPGISPGYRRALLRNRVHYSWFKKKALSYFESEMTEFDFITFLFEATEGRKVA